MEIKIKDTYNFDDYSGFEKIWMFIILCKGILPRKDMLVILKHFNMKFFGDDWENNISLEEIGRALMGDIRKNELLVYLSEYLEDKYPKIFSFKEAEKIYNALFNIDDITEIMKLWLNFNNSQEKLNFRNYIKEKLNTFDKLTAKDKFVNKKDKIISDGYFSMCLEEILVSLYKLAMKSYLK